jgi:hypothetical protein
MGNAKSLGGATCWAIRKAEHAFAKHRAYVAFNEPPYGIAMECETFLECSAAWPEVWWSVLGKHLLHPDNPLHGKAAIKKIMALSHLPGMCDPCVLQTKAGIVEMDPWQEEETYILICIEEILAANFS